MENASKEIEGTIVYWSWWVIEVVNLSLDQ